MADQRSLSAASAGTIAVGDWTVNRLGFGAMRVTGAGIWGDPPDRGNAVAVLRRAVELGVTFIDTADSYGPNVSEELIAEALHPYPEGLVVATKGGLERPGPGRWTANGRPEHLRAALDGSLRRLRLDQIHVYQLHAPDPRVPYEESLGAIAELVAEGKIRYAGVSNVSVAQLDRAQAAIPGLASVQNRYNLTDRSSEDVLARCEAGGLAFLPWAPIQDLDRSTAVSSVAGRHGATAHQIAIAWLLARSPAVLPIPGTSSIDHLDENIAAAAIRLDDEDLAALDGR